MSADTRAERRFVLIDHSIAGEGGHYLEYARHVLGAAERLGFRPILASNKAFVAKDFQWELHKLYERDVWGRRLGRRPGKSSIGLMLQRIRQSAIRSRLRLKYSRLGLPWLSGSTGGISLSRFAAVPRIQYAPAIVMLPLLYLRLVVRSLMALITALVLPLARLSIVRATANVLRALFYPLLWSGQHWRVLLRWYQHRQRTTAFADATATLLLRLNLGSDEVIFIPTLSEADFVGLSRLFRADSRSTLPSWHLLFRRDIYAGREPSYAQDDGDDRVRRALLRATLLEITQKSKAHRVSFYTDTDRLTDQYRRLNAAEFSTLPIPVNETFRARDRSDTDLPLEVVFLGDARSEKGYPLLPPMVEALWREVDAGKVHFTFQSNFGFERTQSDAPVVVSRNALRTYPADVVRIHEKPMKTDEYEKLVLESDIILIPYDAERYYARSSGVLVEALSAGVPVVVPAGSWMSDQIQPEDVAVHDDLRAVCQGGRLISGRLHWQTFEGQNVAARRRTTLTFGGGQLGIWSSIRPQLGETHLLVQFRFDEGLPPGMYCRSWLQFMDRAGTRLGQDKAVLGPGVDGRASALFEIVPGTEQIEFVLSNAFDPAVITAADVEISCLTVRMSADRVPLSAIGRAYADPEHLAPVLREVIANYADYRARAAAFAGRWVKRHNPDRLVHEIDQCGNDVEAAVVENGVA
jgi:glycosyltransferase involved in cell wall biosynthesis